MTKLMYVTYDSKAQTYTTPFYALNQGSALRSFIDIAHDTKHPIGQHPEDYTLFCIGEYDELKGTVKMFEAKKSLGVAQEFIKEGE